MCRGTEKNEKIAYLAGYWLDLVQIGTEGRIPDSQVENVLNHPGEVGSISKSCFGSYRIWQ